MSRLTTGLIAAVFVLSPIFVAETRADVFEYVDEDGKTQTLDGRLYASGQGILAVEPADGSLRLIPQDVVRKRTPGPDPKPITPQQMLDRLRDEFGEEEFRGVISGQYVIGVVLQAELPRASERRVTAALRKSASYMQSIQTMFASFARTMDVQTESSKFPMVVLIFETDEDFEAYTAKATGSRGLSAGNIAGFYSHLTNYLYVRMSECYTFGTPLHEAIHQQCFNTGVFQRLAPIPVWFAEGMASGFEGGGDKVKTTPQKINIEYARLIVEGEIPQGLGWDVIAGSDQIFRGDIFAGPAYVHGWSMHWFLVSNYQKEYAKYLQYVQTLPPLEEVSDRGRQAKFEELFGKSPSDFQPEFPAAFGNALKRQRLPPQPDPIPGLVQQNTNLAGIDLFAESNGREMLVQGKLRNISPIRDMTYYVTIVTDTGTFADWFVPRLKINQLIPLKPQAARRPDGRFSAPGRSFRMRVQSVPADSDAAKAWASGQLPSAGAGRGNER
ncbi:MAG: DUF1570 domain-containing protein [Planctomycetota bacterium]|nr:DUF1570 domain-containing protein [Planctomycetota bacterium]MDA1250707.1 DUF1570 domain-containing protein [Planctomycetota bacterium]